ncbi:hypothetical protein EYF80_000158 [Liparis tanakae]|uniref:Uncharacterized protein n=1 Tax=Liparis tanakae TaxID=230148 RepID=A0A4Z2JH18_9TELE|nr:hypothetical protein EYF80_000158 [Liparis tanakae]
MPGAEVFFEKEKKKEKKKKKKKEEEKKIVIKNKRRSRFDLEVRATSFCAHGPSYCNECNTNSGEGRRRRERGGAPRRKDFMSMKNMDPGECAAKHLSHAKLKETIRTEGRRQGNHTCEEGREGIYEQNSRVL